MGCTSFPPKWWQDYVAGRLTTPQALWNAAQAENPDPAQASDRFLDVPADTGRFDAPERLKAPNWLKGQKYMSQIRRADWSHCDPRLIVWAGAFQMLARKRGIPLYAHSALRPRSVQDRLVSEGRSKTPYPRSAHNIGEAVDVVHGVFHWNMTPSEWKFLHVLGRLALDKVNAELPKAHKLALTWGGDWKFYDPAHWEISNYRDRIRRLPEPDAPRTITPQEAVKDRVALLLPYKGNR